MTTYAGLGYEDYSSQKGWSEEQFAVLDAREAGYLAAELRRHRLSCGGARVLEVGFGNGQVLQFAKQAGADVHGVEIQQDLVSRARQKGFSAYESLDAAAGALAGKPVDLFFLFDIVEHLDADELVALLHRLGELANLGGSAIVARFPNGDSPFGLCRQNGDFTHKTAIGAGVAHQLFRKGGWTITYLGEPARYSRSVPHKIYSVLSNGLRRASRLPWALSISGEAAVR
jgi:2-polyprenyl-3-methyl-5-hydroxy-6-metoxy-1,4-benzoquinol methylase